jgi:hypothetical protein
MGLRWKIGNGNKIRFQVNQWFGSCRLAIQFWEVYSIVNEEGKTVEEVCDGYNLKFTFRRTINRRDMDQWEVVEQIASSIHFL